MAPALPVIPRKHVSELTLLTVTNTATDSNIHSTVGYSLLNPPAGGGHQRRRRHHLDTHQAENNSTNTIITVATSTDTFDQVNPQLT